MAFSPAVDKTLRLSVDLNRLNVSTVILHYSIDYGSSSQIEVDGSSADHYDFTLSGSLLPEGSVLNYAFEVNGDFNEARCSALSTAILPTNLAFQVLATANQSQSNDRLYDVAMNASEAATNQTTIGSQASAETVCAAFFASPTPCDIFTGELISDGELLKSGQGISISLDPPLLSAQTTGLVNGGCEYSGSDYAYFYKDRAILTGNVNGRGQVQAEMNGATQVDQIANVQRRLFAGAGSALTRSRAGYAFSVWSSDPNVRTLQVKTRINYYLNGQTAAGAVGPPPLPFLQPGSGNGSAGVALGRHVQGLNPDWQSPLITTELGDYPRNIYNPEATSTRAALFPTRSRNLREVGPADTEFDWVTVDVNRWYFYSLAFETKADVQTDNGADAEGGSDFSNYYNYDDPNHKSSFGAPNLEGPSPGSGYNYFLKLGRVRFETPNGFGSC